MTDGPVLGKGGKVDLTHGHHYRAVIVVPLIACTMTELATQKLEALGFLNVQLYGADQLPADWPADRVTGYTAPDLECIRYAEGQWDAPSTQLDVPSEVVAVWEYTTPASVVANAPPPATPTPPVAPPAGAPAVAKATSPYVVAGVTALVTAFFAGAGAALFHWTQKHAA